MLKDIINNDLELVKTKLPIILNVVQSKLLITKVSKQ